MPSNYDIMQEQARELFLGYDQQAIISRFDLNADDQYLWFDFLGRPCRVDRATGAVECGNFQSGEFAPANPNETMIVYDLLCQTKPRVPATGRFVSMQSLSSMQGAEKLGASNRFFAAQARELDHSGMQLIRALQGIGASRCDGGDVAAEVPVFADLHAVIRFWDSDDEFDAQLQFLWDENVLWFMHYETVWFANHAIMQRLMDAWHSLTSEAL